MKSFILTLSTLLIALSASADLGKIDVFDEEDGDTYHFFAKNDNDYVYTVFFTYAKLKGFEKPHNLPDYVVVPAGAQKHPLFSLTSTKKGNSNRFNYTISALPGDITKSSHQSDYSYFLPYADNTTQLVGQGYKGRRTHKKIFALDFNMKLNTTVCAARSGKVVAVKHDSQKGGPNKAFMFDANYIIIEHEDGSYADYAHLQYNSCLVKVGDIVKAGDPIAKSGNSGFSSGPHLHFEVYILTDKGKKTIPTYFWVAGTKTPLKGLKQRQVYTAIRTED